MWHILLAFGCKTLHATTVFVEWEQAKTDDKSMENGGKKQSCTIVHYRASLMRKLYSFTDFMNIV